VVDDRLAFVGSANFNHRSFRHSRELNVVFDDPASVAAVNRVVDSVRKGCREVSREEVVRYRGVPFAVWWLIMQNAG
jgi:cardiolipin synthase